MQQQKNPWCTLQPSPCISKKVHYCAFEQCPGLKRNNKQKRAYTSTMKCKECSVMNEKDKYFCMTIADKKVQNCHYKHHRINFPNPNNKT